MSGRLPSSQPWALKDAAVPAQQATNPIIAVITIRTRSGCRLIINFLTLTLFQTQPQISNFPAFYWTSVWSITHSVTVCLRFFDHHWVSPIPWRTEKIHVWQYCSKSLLLNNIMFFLIFFLDALASLGLTLEGKSLIEWVSNLFEIWQRFDNILGISSR